MRPVGKKPKEHKGPVGGLPFFMTLSSALFLGVFNLTYLPNLWDANALQHWTRFLSGAILGALVAKAFIVGHLSVMFHELKHYILSQCAGNKSKGFEVKDRSGFFKYAYNKDTAKFNGMIALAPYWFPLFTIFGMLLAIPAHFSAPHLVTFIVGIGVGLDLLMNMRDISPFQTDLTGITGGYKVALLFITAMNLAILTILAAWVSQGVFGLKVLVWALWDFMVHIVVYYRKL